MGRIDQNHQYEAVHKPRLPGIFKRFAQSEIDHLSPSKNPTVKFIKGELYDPYPDTVTQAAQMGFSEPVVADIRAMIEAGIAYRATCVAVNNRIP